MIKCRIMRRFFRSALLHNFGFAKLSPLPFGTQPDLARLSLSFGVLRLAGIDLDRAHFVADVLHLIHGISRRAFARRRLAGAEPAATPIGAARRRKPGSGGENHVRN